MALLAAAGLLLWAQRAGHIDRLLQQWHAAGKFGQCHVVSICRWLNSDLLFIDMHIFDFMIDIMITLQHFQFCQ